MQYGANILLPGVTEAYRIQATSSFSRSLRMHWSSRESTLQNNEAGLAVYCGKPFTVRLSNFNLSVGCGTAKIPSPGGKVAERSEVG